MKRIADAAEARGIACARIFCSADPGSLDAVILPALHTAVADGTSPHVLEPKYPGVRETLIDLGAFRDDGRLCEHAREVIELTDENKRLHKRATAFLNAAGAAAEELRQILKPAFDEKRVYAFADRLWEKEVHEALPGETGHVSRRFLSAVTPCGVKTFESSVHTLAGRVFVFADESGVASSEMISILAAKAEEAGVDAIRCLNSLSPDAGPEHLILPAHSLAFVTENRFHAFEGERVKNIRCARFFDAAFLREHKHRLGFCKKAVGEMVCEAASVIAEAKAVHDRLERFYIDAMDFETLNAFAGAFTEDLFGREAL
ncbi:MAG: hypothetical protein IJK02_00875 [Clostridia bacterium]|nr:hypothetical protein [Clostridia bacterium]MBR0509392.1 hypothetical protein [Clostridia bacterium]